MSIGADGKRFKKYRLFILMKFDRFTKIDQFTAPADVLKNTDFFSYFRRNLIDFSFPDKLIRNIILLHFKHKILADTAKV